MAVATLSPWPTTPAATAAALACLRAGGVNESDDDRLGAIGAAAGAMVEGYAPGAPQAVKNEATIRLAGWLRQDRPAGPASIRTGNLTIRFGRDPSRNALRQSGAMGLLAPWHKPRALPIAEAD